MSTTLRRTFLAFAALILTALPHASRAEVLPQTPLTDLRLQLLTASRSVSGHVAIAVRDLATGYTSGLNLDAVMPAASTIKVPVMVEVFRQMKLGTFGLQRHVTLLANDKDWGSGDLCDASIGTTYSVSNLLALMIDESDNTATNMLIRLVGRKYVNLTMKDLGLHHTFLRTDVRTATEAVRVALRTTPHDMVRLLDLLAHEQLVDPWSSRAMIDILAHQTHNGLLPNPLPPGTEIAHKTGSLHDTLNDIGIVYLDEEPYAIAVMTTRWPELSSGRSFIHRVSRLAYQTFERFAQWREGAGLPAFRPNALAPAPPAPGVPLPSPQTDQPPADLRISDPALLAPLDPLQSPNP